MEGGVILSVMCCAKVASPLGPIVDVMGAPATIKGGSACMMIDSCVMATESANSISKGTRVIQAISSVIWKGNIWQGDNALVIENSIDTA